jgi:Uncharacterized conserved protein
MKIGVLTFHCAHNYGAVLQCYALQEFLKQQGHNVEIIDYRPHYLLAPYEIPFRRLKESWFQRLKIVVADLLMLFIRIKRFQKFSEYIENHLHLSSTTIKRKEGIPSGYDAYVIGSDQVWSSYITNLDSAYFGDFTKSSNAKVISYAASAGDRDVLSLWESDFLRNYLQKFQAISVREDKLRALLFPLTAIPIRVVADPVFILSSKIWHQMAVKPQVNKKYILVYQIHKNKAVLELANNLAKQIGAIVVQVLAWPNFHVKKNQYQYEDPSQFLGWIKYAECVVATSFHGIAFSTIFNKPFYTIGDRKNKISRIGSLLHHLGLEERIVNVSSFPAFSSIDYESLYYKRDSWVTDSQNFLNTSLGY